MSAPSANNRRIAKNTLLLYVRMAILLGLSVFTSRIILDRLGVVDYGVYNVVGGVAVMFAFLQSSLTNASQRFLSIALGRGDVREANVVFNQHIFLYLGALVVILVLAETVGLWLIYHKLVIPPDRLFAALCVYQFTLLTLCATIIGTVYLSCVISHEDMNVFAYVGMIEGLSKLGIVYLLSVSPCDRLILYGLLYCLVSLAIQGSYVAWCHRHYTECHFRRVWDRDVLRRTGAMISWNAIGCAVYALNDSGVNILINMYFGPAVNAARSLTYQVNGALMSFSANFVKAFQPQLTKTYSAGEVEAMMSLFYRSSRFSFLLMWAVSLPVICVCPELLRLWLVEVPEYTSAFLILVLLLSVCSTLETPVWTLALASMSIRRFTLWSSGVKLLILPLSWVALRMGCSPVSVFVVNLAIRVAGVAVNVAVSQRYIPLTLADYLTRVVRPLGAVLALSALLALVLRRLMPCEGWLAVIYCAAAFTLTSACVWVAGMTRSERSAIVSAARRSLQRFL